jgi:hypothetical protein
MDSKAYEEAVKRLGEVNGVITKLDPAIRQDAFSLLKPYIQSGNIVASQLTSERGNGGSNGAEEDGAVDLSETEQFFTTHEGGKPSENAYLSVAYLYSQYGAQPFSLDDVREVANQAGLTLPDRVDVTLAGAKKSGKPLFKRAGRGKLQPNVHGETYLRNTYGIAKGNKRRGA